MKHILVCNNCGEENPFYRLTCKKCNSFLRARIPNIDLFQTIAGIFESPVKTFDSIIQADHKNFVIWLTLIMSIKFMLVSFQVKNALFNKGYPEILLFTNVVTFIIIFSAIVTMAALVITLLNNALGLKTRFKDNYSLYIYSFIPQMLAAVILFPVELALYREYWFTFNPSPLIVKPTVTYLLFIIEGIMLVWSLILFAFATYSQSRSKIYSVIIGLIMSIGYLLAVLYAPFF